MSMTTNADPMTDMGQAETVLPAVGFIGLGDMGGRIARRIARAKFPLTVFDRRADAIADLAAVGANAAADARSVASASDVVCVCVVDDDQVRQVVSELALRRGSTLVIHSSVLPQTAQDIAARLAPIGAQVADIPVSGSRPAADDGTLTALAGGEASVVEALRPLLAAYCANVIHAGPVGTGSLLKIANNVMLHMNHLVAVEAARFARAHGIEESVLIEAANRSSGRSWVTETWGLIDDMLFDHPLRGTEGIYSIMSKEMWHAVEISRASLVPMQLTALGTQVSKSYFQEREALVRPGRAPKEDVRDE
jgi:3-hydroxyisobutyrate dehydrogenase